MDVVNARIKNEPIDPDFEEFPIESNTSRGTIRVKSEFTETASFAPTTNTDNVSINLFDNPEDNRILDELLVHNQLAEINNKVSDESEESDTNERICVKKEKGSDTASDPLDAEIAEGKRRLSKHSKEFASRLERQCLKRSRSRSRDRNRSSSSLENSRSRRRYSRRKNYSYSRSSSRSSSRSPNRSYRNSKEYKNRSVSRERDRRRRSRSTTRESPRHDRSRHSHRHLTKKRRTRSRERRSKDSFLNELPKILAEKGHKIPEEELRSLLKSRVSSYSDYAPGPSTSYSAPIVYPQPEARGTYEENQIRSNMNTKTFPVPVRVKAEPPEIDYRKIISPERNSNNFALQPKVLEPMMPLMNQIKAEKVEETPEQRKEKVIKLCMEVIGKLSQFERNPITTRLFYTPTTVTKGMGIDENLENRSPLNRLNNVIFQFNSTVTNINLLEWGIIKLNDNCESVSRAMGISAPVLIDKLKCKDSAFSKMENEKTFKSGKFYTPFYIDASAQTEENSCTTCIIRQLRKFTDKSIQAYPPAVNTAVQTEAENDLPIMSIISTLNTAQLIALNDFAELLKGPPASSTNEIFRLRERLMDIYHIGQQAGRFIDPRQQQQSTSLFPSSFPQQQISMMQQQQTPIMAQPQASMLVQQQALMMSQQQTSMMGGHSAMSYSNYNNIAGANMGMAGAPAPVPFPHQAMGSNNFSPSGGMAQNMSNMYPLNTNNLQQQKNFHPQSHQMQGNSSQQYQRQSGPNSTRDNRLPAIQSVGKRREDPRKVLRGSNNVTLLGGGRQSIEGREREERKSKKAGSLFQE